MHVVALPRRLTALAATALALGFSVYGFTSARVASPSKAVAPFSYIPLSDQPTSLAASPNNVVVVGGAHGGLVRFAFDGRSRKSIDVGSRITDVALRGSSAYVATDGGVVIRYDVRGRPRRRAAFVLPGAGDARLAVTEHGVWVGQARTDELTRLSVTNLRPLGRITLPGALRQLTSSRRAVWTLVANPQQPLVEVGLRDGEWTHPAPTTVNADAVGFGIGRLWLANTSRAFLLGVPPDGSFEHARRTALPRGTSRDLSMTVANGSVWLADAAHGTITEFTPGARLRREQPLLLGGRLVDAASVAGVGLWAADAAGADVVHATFGQLDALRRVTSTRRPPTWISVTRTAWGVIAALLLTAMVLAGVHAARLVRKTRVPPPTLPVGVVPLAASLDGLTGGIEQQPDRWRTYVERRRTLSARIGVPNASIEGKADGAEGTISEYDARELSARIMDVMRVRDAEGDLRHEYDVIRTDRLPHRWLPGGISEQECADAMRARHEAWYSNGNLVLIHGATWALDRSGDELRARLPRIRVAGATELGPRLSPGAEPTMCFSTGELVGAHGEALVNRREFVADVLALVLKPIGDEPPPLMMLAIFSPYRRAWDDPAAGDSA